MWRTLAKLSISALLIFALLRNRDLSSLLDQMIAVNRSALIAAALCYAAVAVPSAVRWSIVVAALGHRLTFRTSLSIVLIGYFFNLTLISSIGGDTVRMWKAYRAGLPSKVAVSSVIIERLAQLLAHLIIVAASIPALLYRVHDLAMRAGVLLLLLVGTAGFAVLMTLDRLPAQVLRFRLISAAAEFATNLRRILMTPTTAAVAVLLGLANQITVLLVVAILAAGLHVPIGFLDCLIVVPAAQLLTGLPVSLAGWGVREGSFVLGFSYLGVPADDSLLLSIVFGLLNTVVRLPGALIWLLLPDRKDPRKIDQQID